ncbi:MAG: DUF4350 domain-containing protein [Pseudomonadota bacterium]
MSDSAPFSKSGLLMLLLVGFGAFLAILYFLAIGDTGPENSNNGRAHAGAQGLNGYSALVELVEADGFETTLSREESELETPDLLVLAPPPGADPEELARLFNSRRELGPTLVIVPKWSAFPASRSDTLVDPDRAKEGWVLLGNIRRPRWVDTEYVPIAFELELDGAEVNEEAKAPSRTFETRGALAGITGDLQSDLGWHATKLASHSPLIVDQNGGALALSYTDTTSQLSDAAPNWLIFVVEPDLVNNWGLADESRALAALSLVRYMADDYSGRVVFDLTFNGFGGAMNLLTLAFQPPFLAATLCLILALFVLGWRAFLRFGPSAAPERETAFGKASLVTNGADLIVRAGRLNLLAKPYIKLSEERAVPHTEALAAPADDLRRARKPANILRAARALYRQSQDT